MNGSTRDVVPGLVSVVIPTFNRDYTIGRAIESVLAQTYKHIEVIVADDGSTDDTVGVVRRYDRIRYVRQGNRGAAAARNLGLWHARGEFIALHDSDDEWVPWKLAAQVDALRRFPEVGMVWSDLVAFDHATQRTDTTWLKTHWNGWRQSRMEEWATAVIKLGDVCTDAPAELGDRRVYVGDFFSWMLLGNLVPTPTVVLRAERLRDVRGFDETLLGGGEDYEFHLRTCFCGPAAFLDAATMIYHIGAADQLTAPKYRRELATNNLRTVVRWMERGRDRIRLAPGVMNARLARAHEWLGDEELRCGDRAAARRHLWASVRLRPSVRGCALLGLSVAPRGVEWALRRIKALVRSVFGGAASGVAATSR